LHLALPFAVRMWRVVKQIFDLPLHDHDGDRFLAKQPHGAAPIRESAGSHPLAQQPDRPITGSSNRPILLSQMLLKKLNDAAVEPLGDQGISHHVRETGQG